MQEWNVSKTTFVKGLTSKVILGNPFMALIYPFRTSKEGISTEILGQRVLFKYIVINTITKE